MSRKHNHYFKDVSHLTDIDVYRILDLFGVTDQALGHAIKKLLVAGGRGVKDIRRDIQEAIDTLNRRLEMMDEDTKDDLLEPFIASINYANENEFFAKDRKRLCINVFRSKECGATSLLHLDCNKTFEDCKKFGCEHKFRI